MGYTIQDDSYELMMNFLNEHCPIRRIRNEKKKWVISLVINGVFTGGNSKSYPFNNPKLKTLMMGDVYTALSNVFGFSHAEMNIVAAQYVEIDG